MSQISDTPPEISFLIRQRLMERSGAERMLMSSGMFDSARALVLASLPRELSEIEMRIRLCERIYGSEVDQSGFAEHLREVHRRKILSTHVPLAKEGISQD